MATNGEPILLPGFDKDRQLQCDFKSSNFNAFWLRRTFTDESSHIIQRPGRHKPREIRFGNNITVLLQACYHLRNFYGSPSFWVAVARGFPTMSGDIAKDRASAFMDARRIFLDKGGSPNYVSAATRAADDFMPIFKNRSSLQRPSASGGDICALAAAFFLPMRESVVDGAQITDDADDHFSPTHFFAHFAPRGGPHKRSPSPSLPGQPSSAKRRQFSDTPERSDSTGPQERAPQVLPSLRTGKKIRGTAKQDPWQTPSTPQDETTQDGYLSQGAPDKPAELKIRGQAQTGNFHSPSRDAFEGAMDDHPSSYEELRHANIKLLRRVQALEHEQKLREEASKAMDVRLASLEKRMDASEAEPAQDGKTIQEMAMKLTSLDEKLRESQTQLLDKSRTVQGLKERVEFLEKQLDSKPKRLDDTKAFTDLQNMAEPPQTRKGIIESQAQSTASKLIALEKETDTVDIAVVAKVADPTTRADTPDKHISDQTADKKTVMERLERQVTTLQTKVTSLETRQEVNNKFGGLRDRINTLQEDMMAVREMVKDKPLLDDLLEKIKGRPTSESLIGKVAQAEQAFKNTIESCRKETLDYVEECCRSAHASTVRVSSTRIDKLAEDINKMNEVLHNIQKNTPKAQNAQPSVNVSEHLERLDELSLTVNSILEDETRLAIPSTFNRLFQRVEIIEKVLRNLRDAYDE